MQKPYVHLGKNMQHMRKPWVQQEKVDFLDSAIKSLTNRGFNLKAAIDWEKFKMGV